MANLTKPKPRAYNGRMAKPKRSARLAARVDESVKKLAEQIAETMNWSMTDVYEKGIVLLSKQKDVRDALAKPKEEG